jgi:hypothetical protein
MLLKILIAKKKLSDGENESFNATFKSKNTVVNGMVISIQNYKMYFAT